MVQFYFCKREENRYSTRSTNKKLGSYGFVFMGNLSILISQRLPIFCLKVILVLVEADFENSFRYYQQKCSKVDDGKPLKVIEKIMKSHGISKGQKSANPVDL